MKLHPLVLVYFAGDLWGLLPHQIVRRVKNPELSERGTATSDEHCSFPRNMLKYVETC